MLVRVVQAIPEEGFEFRPHEKSRSVKELINTLIAEIYMTKAFVEGQSVTAENAGSFFANVKPQTIAEAVEQMTKANNEFLASLTAATEDSLKAPVKFFHRETTADDAIFNMMMDLVHHRGQLSVYVRLAGGKVPSIYGPSADEEMPS